MESSEESKKSIEFAERLNHALDLRKYPPLGQGRIAYVQETFTLSRHGAIKWVHGKCIPHKKKREEIANVLGINLQWLETGEGDPLHIDSSRFEATSKIIELPFLSLSEAHNLEKTLQNKENLEKIIVANTAPINAFAVKLVGSSMFPRFNDGSVLIIDPDDKPSDGDFVLAVYNFLPEAICRQFFVGSDINYLIAINPKFDPIPINENIRILGKIIEVRTEL